MLVSKGLRKIRTKAKRMKIIVSNLMKWIATFGRREKKNYLFKLV